VSHTEKYSNGSSRDATQGNSRDSFSVRGGFRRLPIGERRRRLSSALGIPPEEERVTGSDAEVLQLADVMVETAVGYVPVPLGIAGEIIVDGEPVNVPLALEEPSVVAAASYAGTTISRHGGFTTETSPAIMRAHVYLEDVTTEGEAELRAAEEEVRRELAEPLERMNARGGGFRGIEIERLDDGTVAAALLIDTCDAMGANVLNTAAERVKPLLAAKSGGRAVMAILTNAATDRVFTARFRLPFSACARGSVDGAEMARRVEKANRIASLHKERAVTHNKGIMNGITSLALATANDTRATEAAAHAYAARNGGYRPLTTYRVENGALHGSITLPLSLGSVGGAVGFHPAARLALRILGHPSARRLGAIAAALGLAQNFAALSALVGEGIQKGHMRLHAIRLAYAAGARGGEISPVAKRITDNERYNKDAAAQALESYRNEQATERGFEGSGSSRH